MSSKWNKIDFKQLNLSLFNRQNGKFKKAAVLAFLISSLTFNLGFAKEIEDKDAFEKIYHVYVANSYIGSVSDETVIQQLVEQKEQEARIQYKELFVDASSNITVIPEQVFKVEAKDSETLEKLQEVIEVEAQAYALQVNGTPVAYLKDQNDYEDAINLLKLQYVSQEEIDELNTRQVAIAELPPLQKDATRILEIALSADITGSEASVLPSSIVTVEEAVQLLQTGSLEQQLYTVKAGDVLGSIAHAHGLKTAELVALNPSINEDSVLNIGQQINVTVHKPYVSVNVVYEKKNTENIDYAKITEEDDTMLKGEKVVKQEGASGKKEVSYLITEENGIRVERAQTSETILQEPENRVVVIGTKVIPSRGTGTFAWPTNGGYISSDMGARWGSYHRGIDIARPSNYAIKASDNGVVTFTGWDGTYGNKIVVNHNNGYETIYAHLSKISVSVGQVVAQGSSMGIMGSTGRSTGIHLHFEVHKNGSYVNPLSYLK
ncbi:M23 family metallopeptidase [Solibacillus sp. FSL H8-0538]|uniref:M23 family metallopeptidase n=1 Tax=Solibacillus sp. FSL H8-0538 TaxID=2921400 RepID=UPI0030FA3D0C